MCDDNAKLKFEEYKLFVDDTARFTERRQTITNIYIGVNSVLLGGIGLLVKDAGLQSWVVTPSVLALLAAGIVICVFWGQLIRKYKALVGFRIDQLRKMELIAEMQWSHRMYHAEDELYPRDENDQPVPGVKLNFSDLEARLPIVFIIIYAVFGFFLLFALAYGMV
jgi:hypothetical protein